MTDPNSRSRSSAETSTSQTPVHRPRSHFVSIAFRAATPTWRVPRWLGGRPNHCRQECLPRHRISNNESADWEGGAVMPTDTVAIFTTHPSPAAPRNWTDTLANRTRPPNGKQSPLRCPGQTS